jgi:hypothetical protein
MHHELIPGKLEADLETGAKVGIRVGTDWGRASISNSHNAKPSLPWSCGAICCAISRVPPFLSQFRKTKF